MPPKEKGRHEGDPIPNNVCQDTPESKSALLKTQVFCAIHAMPTLTAIGGPHALEAKLWHDVQRAYARSRDYRAGNNPEYAKALAALAQVANADEKPSNVLPFKRPGARS